MIPDALVRSELRPATSLQSGANVASRAWQADPGALVPGWLPGAEVEELADAPQEGPHCSVSEARLNDRTMPHHP